MANIVNRRALLATAALGLTGASALGSFAPEAAAAAQAPVLTNKAEPGAPDPNFAEGRITGISDTMLFVTGSDGALWRIRTTNATSIWKLKPTDLSAAKVGDGLYARGVRMPDGTLAADAVWLNIVNIQVHITAMSRDKIHMEHHGSRITGHVVHGTSAAVYNGTPAVSDLSRLEVGKHVQVIGAWVPDTNEIEIATVYN